MQTNHRLRRFVPSLRIAIAGALIVASGTMAFVASKKTTGPNAPTPRAYVHEKEGGELDQIKPGDSMRALFGPNESRSADNTPEMEKYLLRAYPADEVSGDSTLNAKS